MIQSPLRFRTSRADRAAFTLTELLIVIAVIVVLASIAIPTTGVILRKVKYIDAGNNMRQIYTGIIDYQTDHDGREVFPPTLSSMFEPGGHLITASPKLLLDPMDPMKGTSPWFGRPQGWGDWCLDLHAQEDLPISFLYEVSAADFTKIPLWDDWDDGWWSPWFDTPPTTGDTTWYDFKLEQSLRGNVDEDKAAEASANPGVWAGNGFPFPKDEFPIIRSFWHYKWKGNDKAEHTLKKVLGCSWNGSIFSSSPYWEHDSNPFFELPD